MFTIFANAFTKQIKVKNKKQEEKENFITTINSNVPENFKLNYKRSEKINIVPIDPCGESFGLILLFPKYFAANLLLIKRDWNQVLSD